MKPTPLLHNIYIYQKCIGGTTNWIQFANNKTKKYSFDPIEKKYYVSIRIDKRTGIREDSDNNIPSEPGWLKESNAFPLQGELRGSAAVLPAVDDCLAPSVCENTKRNQTIWDVEDSEMLIWGIGTQDMHNMLYKLSATWTDIFPLTPGWQVSWFRWSDPAVLLFNMLYTSGNVTRSISQKADRGYLPSERIRIGGLEQRKKTEKDWYYEYFSNRWQGLSCNPQTWKPKTATTFYTNLHRLRWLNVCEIWKWQWMKWTN